MSRTSDVFHATVYHSIRT